MATLSALPIHLRQHARALPKGLLERLHQGEAEHRLQAVREMTASADRISNPGIHRHVLAHAKRLRDAMPYLEFTAERTKLSDLRDTASNANTRLAYAAAIRELEDKHEQVNGVGEAIMQWDKAHPVAKASRAAMLKTAHLELARATADIKRKQDELRKEIRELRERAERGQQ